MMMYCPKPFRTQVCFLLLLLTTLQTHAQDVRSQLRQVAGDLAKQLEAKGKKRVIIASFLDLKNQETELGRYMADKFSIGISTASMLEITDRSQLAQLLRDNKLGAERILDPKTIPTLGRLTGAEVIVIGNYTPLDNSVDITVKAIDLERGIRLAIAESTIPLTPEINKLLADAGSPVFFDQTLENPGNSENPRKDPDKKCATNHTGGYCFQNTSKAAIKINFKQPGRGVHASFTVNPGLTECAYGLNSTDKGETTYIAYVYKDPQKAAYEKRTVAVTECQVKTLVLR
jgi:hypothetical protein